MSGASHAISVSIDTYRLVDQHSFQRAPWGCPMASFPTILFQDLMGVIRSILVWHLRVTHKIGRWIRKT